MSVADNKKLNSEEVQAKKTRLKSFPLQFNFELTGVCNVVPPCAFCTVRSAGVHFPSSDSSYLEKYGPFFDNCEMLCECSPGEPLLTKAFFELVERVKEDGRELSASTNGLLLDKKAADALISSGGNIRLNVSINAATAETYHKLTGQDFDKLIGNIERFVTRYREANDDTPPIMTLSFIVMRLTREEVIDFIRLGHRLGATPKLLMLNEVPGPTRDDFGYRFVYRDERLSAQEYAEIAREAKAFVQETGGPLMIAWDDENAMEARGVAEAGVDIPCLLPWRFLVVRESTKEVYGCCYHTRPIGSIARRSLDKVWNGRLMRKIRKTLVKGKIPMFCRVNSMACPLLMTEKRTTEPDRTGTRITMGPDDGLDREDGWYPVENLHPKIRWTSGKARFRLRRDSARTLALKCMCPKPDIKNRPLTGRVEVDGRMVGTFILKSPDWQTLHFELPDSDNGLAHGEVIIDDPWRPSEVADSVDDRTLGIAVREIWTE